MIEPVELRGALVALVTLCPEHAAELLGAADSDEVFAWLPYPRPTDLAAASAWIDDALADRAAGTRFPFAVLDPDGTVLGSTSYWAADGDGSGIEIGSTWLAHSAWGGGHNVEAKLLLMTHAFETLGRERVAFRTDSLNVHSRRAILALGAIEEGVISHERRRRDGTWRDSTWFSLLSAEWPRAKARLEKRLAKRAGAG